MNVKIEQLQNRLERLEKFIISKEYFQKKELISWISSCVSLFTELGVSNEIISKFMETFEFDDSVTNWNKIGPFLYSIKGENSGFRYFRGSSYKSIIENYYVNIAFTTSKVILKHERDEERLVPKFLISAISENGKYSNILSSLELLERFYQEKNEDGLLKESITLLSSILSIVPKLKDKKDLGPMLMCLVEKENEDIRKKFGVDPDFIRALNNSRLIRNSKSVHKELPIRYDIPYLVSLSCAYLVILFLEITMSTGDVIK